MRVRKPFAGAFAALLLLSGYLGFAPIEIPQYKQSDKGLHFVTFFALTLTFYWILETSRRRVLNLTLVTCTAVLGAGSEIVQEVLPNGRSFDPFDILANVLGSLAALGLCAWYHRRMLERKRVERYGAVAGDEELGELGDEMELHEGTGPQETGVTSAGQRESTNIDDELANWNENAEDDWDDQEAEGNGVADGKKVDVVMEKRND